MTDKPKKRYTIKGEIVGTHESSTIEIDIYLSDAELERIKALIKTSDSDDLRWVVKGEFPDLCNEINMQLSTAAYAFYNQEYKDYYAENEDDEEEDIELTGEEYSCPIPKEWC